MAEARKYVTVVFADVSGSTALGERLDPETLRHVMERYFAEARQALERHGGTVEKFIGDAVMAVFGIPAAHEDDALRAVKAAADMRAAIAALNESLERERGLTLAVRTGINTGEVVAGDPSGGQFFASGDAVNVTARLEQAAAPGEILLGEETYRQVRDAVRVERVGFANSSRLSATAIWLGSALLLSWWRGGLLALVVRVSRRAEPVRTRLAAGPTASLEGARDPGVAPRTRGAPSASWAAEADAG
jgi:class 3 adenylate cyclase